MESPGRALLQDIEDTREQAGLCGSLFWKPDRVGVSEDRREGFFASAVFWEPRAQGSLACHCVRRGQAGERAVEATRAAGRSQRPLCPGCLEAPGLGA